ncbi:unnamed protein product [Clonostachys rosea]|uniref:protein-ribulosamine 3-kinase n=1 Tax=Bionectria ochroleuca TaxID=29856 RepID=A0ABY6TR82_BIOOC|nr:unnamed protein product [Clonostachys rosea]
MDERLDPAILAALPEQYEVIEVREHGTSSWSSGYIIEGEVDGEECSFFLKIIARPGHAQMALGEYESQKALGHYLPDNAVIPLAHGTLEEDDSKSFFLAPFREFTDEIIEKDKVIEVLTKLHTSAISPTGKFGFEATTFNGVVPLLNEWCDSWEEYFTRQFLSDIKWEQSIRGPDPEFDEIATEFFAKVIPRLLRPLQSGNRSITPVLIHGDIWHGNVKIDQDTSNIVLFDSCCCYAHNELELYMMREERYQFSNGFIEPYLDIMGKSEPAEDFDDRNALYAM